MADDPQGIISFTGIDPESILSGSFTLSHGITPSTGTLQVLVQQQPYEAGGTLAFEFGSTKFEFPDCRIIAGSATMGNEGESVTLTIQDRRWKWVNQHISGWYNKRSPDGQISKEPIDFEKTPQELAKLLLDEMKEGGYDVSKLPNDDRPEVNWDYANPAQELANLAEMYGCRVVLGLDNKVRLCVLGDGPPIPANGREVTDSIGVDPPERPDSIKFVASPTRWQGQFELEPVGEDITDGKIKPIDELSYKPATGWDKEYPGAFQGVPDDIQNDDVNDNTPFEGNTKARQRRRLCLDWVFKAYRIKCEAGATVNLFDSALIDASIRHLEQILPLADGLVEVYVDPLGAERHKAEYIEGLHWRFGIAELNKNGRTTEGFSLDRERGIVMFSNYMYRLGPNGETLPAQLYLTCSTYLKHVKTFSPIRYTRERKLPGKEFKTGPRVVARDDIYKTVKVEYGSDRKPVKKVDNLGKIDKHITYYLDAAQKEFETVQTLEKEYEGWHKIQPDGATHQVTWTVSDRGAFTKASQNSEHKRFTPGYLERRRREKQAEAQAVTPGIKKLLAILNR